MFCVIHTGLSSVFVEANELSLLSESSSGHVDAVLSDETLAGAGNTASSGVLTVFSGVRVELLLQLRVGYVSMLGRSCLHFL